MKCPHCNNDFSEKKVTHTIYHPRHACRIRRRVCSRCGKAFKTIELNLDKVDKTYSSLAYQLR